MNDKRILLIIGGGIAAYKCLELIRRLRERGADVRVVMTKAAAQFVTPLSVAALSNDKVYSDLFNLNDEHEIGHIRLSREADMILVAPATADLLAKMAGGHGDDLASCVLLANDKPVLVAPAMNPKMWQHRATQRNLRLLKSDGIRFVEPQIGEMAEGGEAGEGRLADLPTLLGAIANTLQLALAGTDVGAATGAGTAGADINSGTGAHAALRGKHVLITAGPTHEPIDPVRYIANRSSGKQGYAIAAAAAAHGAKVTLIAGPTNLPDPDGVAVHHVETAAQMLDAVQAALPAQIAIFAAAVADWRVASQANEKLKKHPNTTTKPTSADAITGAGAGARSDNSKASLPGLQLVETRDILKTIARQSKNRPALVIGFAAETEHLIKHAKAKLKRKGCDWIIANDVSATSKVMGGDRNTVHILSSAGVEDWPQMSKTDVAHRLIEKIAAHFVPARQASKEPAHQARKEPTQ